MRRSRLLASTLAFTTLLAIPGTALAKGGPPAGRGGGSGGGSGETTTANNLSVPAVMVNGGFTGVTCDVPLRPPTGEPRSGYPIGTADYYYVQGLNTWQAECVNASSASVTADWGDNLTGSGKLSVGSPIRVELGLFNANTAAPALQGYTVVKLDPNALDRESAYGTLASGSPGAFVASPVSFAPAAQRVYAGGATFSIQNVATSGYVVAPNTAASAEINATGAVVYGYNLRVTAAGTYLIVFTFPDTITFPDGTHSASISINVTAGGGGGGGGGVGTGGGAGGGRR